MNKTFQRVAFIFFLGFGAFYLISDFLINQGGSQSELIRVFYTTFDMPFFFSAGLYVLASLNLWVKKNLALPFTGFIFWGLAIIFMLYLLTINLGYPSIL
jgi:peptidoglycan/LPS O-acetylase OafA/YrhL